MTRSEDARPPSDADIAGLDALDGEQGPARPLSALEREAAADRVLQRLGASSASGREPSRVGREATRGQRSAIGRGFGSRRGARWLVVAAGVTLATAAAALYGNAWITSQQPASGASPGDGASKPPGDGAPKPPVQIPAPLPGSESRMEGDFVHPAPPLPDEVAPPHGRPIGTPPAPDRDGGSRAPTRAHESPRAADHLARANALRGKHRYREALERYLHVVSEYPGSMQGRTAQLAAAAIRLEQLKDFDGAEHLYQAVMHDSDGELAAQALFGLAEVARARADRGAEVQALRRFLARHGGHPLASAGRRRLNELESP